MTAYTSGPWYVTLNSFRVGHRGPLGMFRLVADCPSGAGLTEEGFIHRSLAPDDEILAAEAQANARLIAQAPAMVEALRDLLDTPKTMNTGIGEMPSDTYAAAEARARSILATIEGK